MSLSHNSATLLALIPAVTMLLTIPAASAIKCFKTEVGAIPHALDCDPTELGCRIIVMPYSTKNSTAVSNCAYGAKEPGSFIYDCAVDCPSDKKDFYWNELQCCTGAKCNDGTELSKKKLCYVSSPDGTDNIVECNSPKQCALNTKTGATSCIVDDSCGGDWWCCKGEDCPESSWGVFKPIKTPQMEESTDANGLTASLALSVMSALVVCAATVP